MRLRGKLVLLASGLGAALVTVALVLVHLLLTRHTLDVARDDIAAARAALRQAIATSLESYRVLGELVSNETIAKEALLNRTPDLAFTYVDSVHDRTGAEYLVLVDAAGEVITDHRPDRGARAAAPLPPGPRWAEPEARTGFLSLDGTLVAAAVVPVTLGGRVLGGLVLGEAVTDETLARVRTSSRSHITLVVDGGRPISTLAGSEADTVARTTSGCEAARSDRVVEAQLGDTPHLVTHQPLHDLAGRRLGCVVLTRSLAPQLAELRDLRRWLAGLGLVIVVLGLAGGWVISARIVQPIDRLTASARIVKEGDLSRKIEVETRDEVGDLAQVFAELVERLRDIPANLRQSVELLSAAVENLTASAGAQTAMIATQAVALQEMQVTVREIKQTSRTAADKAAGVVRVAERAEELDRVGSTAIERTLAGITEVIAEVQEVSQRTEDLDERARQIGRITETVKDLADQSNMLALNAAIEAARSGEHGRGFAVVAREIRALADQSIQATHRVRDILADISGAIRSAVSRTDTGMQKMEAGLVQARSSGESLRELSTIMRESFAAARQIGAAVSQQDAGVNQMTSAVGDLGQMMDALVERIEVTNKAVGDLRSATLGVTDLVQRFRA